MQKRRRLWLILPILLIIWLCLSLLLQLAGFWRQPPPSRPPVPPDPTGLLQPNVSVDHAVAHQPTVQPAPKPTPVPLSPPAAHPAPIAVSLPKVAPLQLFLAQEPPPAASPSPSPLSEDAQEPSEDWGAYGRRVRCHLVNAVDSSSITTPLIGVVDEDLVWNGRVLIARCSEVHGTMQLDKEGEKIASEGAFTFILHNPDGPGFYGELVVKGQALDREDDPRYQTFSIDNSSAGIRGMVIRTDNLAELKLFAASFISGISTGFAGTGSNIFGQTFFALNARGAGNIPGYLINPAVGALQSVLDLYARRMLDAIGRDGYFLRIPPGKTFYVYIRQDIDLAKATSNGDAARRRAENEFLTDRERLERIIQPRSERSGARDQTPEGSNLPEGISAMSNAQLDKLNQQIQRVDSQFEAQAQSLQQAAASRAKSGTRLPVDQQNAQAEAP
jgi:hypothetical protein